MNRWLTGALALSAALAFSSAWAQPGPGGDWLEYEIEVLDCYKFDPQEQCDPNTDVFSGDKILLDKITWGDHFFYLRKSGDTLDFPMEAPTLQGEPQHPSLEARFEDRLYDPPVRKILELTAVRLNGEPNQATCKRWLIDKFESRMSADIRTERCAKDDLFYWRIGPEIGPLGPPGDGEGTGSGSGN